MSVIELSLVKRYFGTGGDEYHDYRVGKGKAERKRKKAQRRAQKRGRRNSR